MSLAYHAGCLASSLGRDLERATRLVSDRLAIGLTDLDWSCCGGPAAPNVGPALGRLTSTLNLSKAAQAGASCLVTGCPACLRHLEATARDLAEARPADLDPDPGVAEQQARAREVKVEAVHEAILEALLGRDPRPAVVRPLAGLKVVVYYGCRLYADAAGKPRQGRWALAVEEGLTHLGATVLDFGGRGECNGGVLTLSRSEIVEERTSVLLDEVRELGAEAMVVLCALCHFNMSQRPLDDPLPLLYFSQAVGVALGLDPGDLGLGLLSPGRRLLARLGII